MQVSQATDKPAWKQIGLFQQQEKRWSTVKQVFITSYQGSAIIQMIITVQMHHLAGGWPGTKSLKCEKLYQSHRTAPDQKEQKDC